MGLRGPQPKSTKIRKLEGNPSKRPLNEREPEPRGSATCPAFITGAAAEEWQRAVSAMPHGFYTAADVPTLVVYVLAWVTYRNAMAAVARDGTTAIGSMGQAVISPNLLIGKGHAELILKSADRLGMSPTARARLEVQDEPEKSKFDGLLGANVRLAN